MPPMPVVSGIIASGVQRYALTAKGAAEFASTDGYWKLPELHLPWTSFVIDVPERLLGDDVTHVVVSVADGRITLSLVNDGGVVEDVVAHGVLSALQSIESASPRNEALVRIVLGSCVELTRLRESEPANASGDSVLKRNTSGQIQPCVYAFTRTVQLDRRKIIRDYVRGSGNSPTCWWITRGHEQRVHHGKGRAQIKTVFREPFRNGNPDGPMAVRAHAS
jgi:hypothetical protein